MLVLAECYLAIGQAELAKNYATEVLKLEEMCSDAGNLVNLDLCNLERAYYCIQCIISLYIYISFPGLFISVIQWNPYNADTLWNGKSVLIIGVSHYGGYA